MHNGWADVVLDIEESKINIDEGYDGVEPLRRWLYIICIDYRLHKLQVHYGTWSVRYGFIGKSKVTTEIILYA